MKKMLLFLPVLLLCLLDHAQTLPVMRQADRIRIHEAELINRRYGNQIWKGMSKVPFTVLLVTDSCEYLINPVKPPREFAASGYDSLLKTTVYTRKPVYDKHLLATFPAVDGQTCVVIGTPENTGLSSTPWIITLLHEHFHHYTYNDEDYFKDVKKLKLAGSDTTGMWMLNYRFPYDSVPVIKQYAKFSKALYETVKALESDSFELVLLSYAKARTAFRKMLKSNDYKYFSFQVWQEGVARYTEYKYLEMMEHYRPTNQLLALPDYLSFNDYRDQIYKQELNKLLHFRLNGERRICFYSVGFAEAILLDNLNQNWRKSYLKQKFYMEKY